MARPNVPVALARLTDAMDTALRHVPGPGAVAYDLTSRRTLFQRDAHIGLHTRYIAKTGTLDGVTNLAGLCHSDRGQMVAFALFLDGPTLDQARVLLTQMVGAIASY